MKRKRMRSLWDLAEAISDLADQAAEIHTVDPDRRDAIVAAIKMVGAYVYLESAEEGGAAPLMDFLTTEARGMLDRLGLAVPLGIEEAESTVA